MRKKIIDSLNWRYAVKHFDPNKKISEEDMETLIDSLRLTASSFGLQLWEFVRVKNPAIRQKLCEKSWNQKQVIDASDLLVLCIKADATEEHVDQYIDMMVNIRGGDKDSFAGFKKTVMGFIKNKPNDQVDAWMRNQVYIALGNLLTVCALLGIDACPMEGIIKTAYDEILGLQKMGLRSVVACPVGYRDEKDKYANLPKVRFPVDMVLKVIE